MKEIVFILSSLCDSHYRKRVEEFAENGYKVTVYGFVRKGIKLQSFPTTPIILGEISNRNYISRLSLFRKSIKSIAKECRGKLCFYGSLDVAIFGRIYIRSRYIYEVCDLTELTIKNRILRTFLVNQNERTIKDSVLTIFTSEGFFDFYKKIPQNKCLLIPNKVSNHCPPPIDVKRPLSQSDKFRIGFVGVVRYETIYNFIKVCAEKFSNIEIHIFGIYSSGDQISEMIKRIEKHNDNIVYHGPFTNPDDLPHIYSQIDMVLCTYTPCPSVIYAEPNKLYEAMYFKCPIIVSSNTFLGRKVDSLKIGYVVDATNELEIEKFISSLTIESYNEKIANCLKIDGSDCINDNSQLFDYLKRL